MKRLLTYLSAIIIMMMVPIGAQADTSKWLYLSSEIWGWNVITDNAMFEGDNNAEGNTYTKTISATDVNAHLTNNQFRFRLKACYGSKGNESNKWSIYPTTDKQELTGSNTISFSEGSSDNYCYFTPDQDAESYTLTFTYGSTREIALTINKAVTSTTATLEIYGGSTLTSPQTAAPFHFYIPESSYTKGDNLIFTIKTEQGSTTTYYGNSTTFAEGPKAYNVTSSSSSNTCTYAVPSNATGTITVSLLENLTELVIAHQTSGGGGTSTGYYLVGDLNAFGRPYNDVDWGGKNWGNYGAINKVLKFKDNGNGTYSLRIPAAHPAENENEWDKPSKEKQDVSHQFVIAPEDAFSGTEYSGDLYTVGDDNAWKSAWGLTIPDWSKVLRPNTDNKTLNNANTSGNMTVKGGDDCWEVKMNGGSYTITINPSERTWSVTNDKYTHVMYVISKQDGYWRASYLTDVTTGDDQAYDRNHGNNSGELSEFPNESGSTVYVAHNWYEHGSNKKFSTKEHLTIFGAWNTNGDLAPVTWIKATSGATAKSIFPTAGKYSTAMDPTRGTTGDVTQNSQKIITNNNQPSIGNIVGAKGDAALISPDATLSPGTTTYDNYTVNTPVNLTVTMNSYATGYKYSYGTDTPSTTGSNTDFGVLSYDGTNVKLNGTTVAEGNTVTIRIQGTKDTSEGAIHDYTYTFNVPVVSNLDFTPKGGLFINSAKITVTGGTEPYTYTVKDASDASGKVLSTGNFVLADNDREDNYRISTPGYLTVTDALGNTATSTELFDFTYSTSENYKNYTSNATISKTVQTGGGEGALNVFMQVDETLETLWLYAYNKTLDTEWKKQHGEPAGDAAKQAALDKEVRLTSAFPGDNIKDADQINIDGIKYVHFTIPEDNLREGDKVAIIVSQGTTKQQYWYTQTTDKGIEIERTSDPAFIYVVKNSPSAAPSTGSENSKGTNYLLKMSENGTRTIFVTVPEGWNDGTIYCDGWKDGGGEQDKLAWKSSAECLQLYDASTRTYIYQVPDIITNFYIATKNSAGTQTKRSVAVSYSGGRKMYTIQSSMSGSEYNMTETSEGVPDADLDELTTFLNTPPTTTVITNKYPNGEDYWRAAPGDLSIKLDPTWGGKTLGDESSTRDWAGNVPKRVNTEQMPLTQTIQGLNAGKTYTVQAIVRGLGENKKTVTLTLEGATTVTKTINLRNGSGGGEGSDEAANLSRKGNVVNKYGRIEYIEPLNLEGMNKYTGNNAGGWAKVEAKVKASQAGWLTISLTGESTDPNGWFDLSQVTLLEDANTDHGFRTTASTSATDTDLTNVDFRDRSWKKNNAFSFFDRGKNRNAVVFADKRTVIAMDPDKLANVEQNATLRNQDRRHPFNVVATDGATDTNGEASVLYLTDMGYGGNTTDYPGDEDNPVDYDQTGNITGYSRSGYTFMPTLPFTASKVVMDRPIGNETKHQTTIMLPFAISQSELQTYYGSALEVWSYASCNTDERKINFTKLEGDLVANTPYILTGAVNPNTGGTAILDSRNNTSSEAKTIPAVTSTMYATAEKNYSCFTGTYEYKLISRGDDNETHYGYNPTTGKFQIAAKGGAALKPFRAYFTVPIPLDKQNAAPAYTVVFDDVSTGISTVEQAEVEDNNVYTISGMYVGKLGADKLHKGVYIVNGKKYVVK